MHIHRTISGIQLWMLFAAVMGMYAVLAYMYMVTGRPFIPWHMDGFFADLTYISYAAECMKDGINPYLNPVCDPWMRPYNYPVLWLHIWNVCHLNLQACFALGTALVAAFVWSTVRILKEIPVRYVWYPLLLLCSPAVLLLLERGNTDILIFALTSVGIVYSGGVHMRKGFIRLYAPYVLFFILGMLKLYPFVLLGLVWFDNRIIKHRLQVFMVCALAVLLYGLAMHEEILNIVQLTPRPQKLAFGRLVYLHWIVDANIRNVFSGMLFFSWVSIAYLCSGLFYRQPLPIQNVKTGSSFTLFLSGALLYGAVFFVGNSYIYKLVFLLLCVPFLLSVFKTGNLKTESFVLLFIILIRFYYNGLMPENTPVRLVYVLDIVLSWGILGLLTLFVSIFAKRNVHVRS